MLALNILSLTATAGAAVLITPRQDVTVQVTICMSQNLGGTCMSPTIITQEQCCML